MSNKMSITTTARLALHPGPDAACMLSRHPHTYSRGYDPITPSSCVLAASLSALFMSDIYSAAPLCTLYPIVSIPSHDLTCSRLLPLPPSPACTQPCLHAVLFLVTIVTPPSALLGLLVSPAKRQDSTDSGGFAEFSSSPLPQNTRRHLSWMIDDLSRPLSTSRWLTERIAHVNAHVSSCLSTRFHSSILRQSRLTCLWLLYVRS